MEKDSLNDCNATVGFDWNRDSYSQQSITQNLDKIQVFRVLKDSVDFAKRGCGIVDGLSLDLRYIFEQLVQLLRPTWDSDD